MMTGKAIKRVPPAAVLAAILCGAFASGASAASRVVASIKPLHSLAAGVMKGVGEPYLLMKGSASPHTFTLKPSDARAISDARLIFWVGESLSPVLARVFSALPKRAKVVSLMDAKGAGLARLKFRKGGLWEDHDHEHGEERKERGGREARHGHDEEERGKAGRHGHGEKHDHGEEKHGRHEAGHDEHDHDGFDPHLWLDPLNARRWTSVIARELGEADPGNKEKYEANARRLQARLDALHQELQGALAPVRSAPYVVFHDAYQYFEKRYGLNAVGSVSASPEKRPGAARLAEIRARIRKSKSVCVFHEPQFRPDVVNTIIRGTSAGTGEMDPLGARIPAGEDAYFALMRGLAKSLRTCLLRRS